jgi:hypothetical protein
VGTFQKNIIVRVRAGPYGLGGSDPKALLPNGLKCTAYGVFTPLKLKPRTADNLFGFGINVPTDAQLNRASNGKHPYLCGRPEGL